MNTNVRSALVGGLAATFVVAAALAPKLMSSGQPTDVRFHQTAAEATVSTDTTVSTEPPTTTTQATTPTTIALTLEQRVTEIEKVTTTTTVAPIVPPTVSLRNAVTMVDGTPTLSVMFYNHQDARSRAAYPNPVVRIGMTIDGAEVQFTAPIPAVESGTFTVPAPGATPDNITAHVLDTEWTGGSLPSGAGS